MKKLIIHIVGWTFILLGIVGLVLPVLQGFLFICVGLLILSKELPWADRVIKKLRQKYPKLGSVIESARTYMDTELEKLRTQKGYFWRRLPFFLLVLVILVALSIGLSFLFRWVKGLIFD